MFFIICVRQKVLVFAVLSPITSLSGSFCVRKNVIPGLSGSKLTTCIMSRRSTLHQASTQPCYLLPTLSPGLSPGAHLSRVPTRTRQPAASNRPDHPPAPSAPSTPHCPACPPSVPGCPGASIPTSGLTPAIPHPAAAS